MSDRFKQMSLTDFEVSTEIEELLSKMEEQQKVMKSKIDHMTPTFSQSQIPHPCKKIKKQTKF